MKYNYFTYKGITYVIVYDKKQRIIYKLDNNELVSLNESENRIITDLFSAKDGYVYNSEKLNAIISSNKNLNGQGPINLVEILQWLEHTIPAIYLDNFYDKLATLNINLKLDAIYGKKIPKEKYGLIVNSGEYNIIFNTINFNPESVKVVYQIAQKTDNPSAVFYNEIIHTLIHELWHMASSKYDKKSKIALSGFDKYPTNQIEENNKGLTEGMSEFLATCALPSRFELANNYYFETCFVIQLCSILNFSILLDSYLGNKGTRVLEAKLTQLGFDASKAYELFRNIQANYCLFNIDGKQNILGNIQSTLLDYLDAACALDNKKIALLDNYRRVMIDLKILKAMNKNLDNYEGISESIEKFERIKDKYKKLGETDISRH